MELIPDLPKDVDDLEVFWDVFDGGVVMLLTGTVNDPSIGMKGDFCAVATMPPNATAARDLEAWIGAKLPKDGYLMFADEPGGRKMIKQDDTRALLLAVRDDRLRMAGAKTEDKMTLLMLLALRL